MNHIITISREFGSGGRTVGKKVAEQLGIPCYDSELIQKIAEESGFAENYVKEAGEYTPGGFLSSALSNRAFGPTNEDILWEIQCRVISELAEKGPCVIVGRCADYILRDRKDCLHVFICSDMASRARRIVERYGQTQKAPEKRLAEKDQKRKVYYKNYTGRVWGQAQNYDICLNSGALGVDTCTDMIVQLCK
jgi:cytidylate kinase